MISKIFLISFLITVKAVSLTKKDGAENDVYVIRSALSPLVALVIQPDNYTYIGSYLRLQHEQDITEQLWHLEYQFEPGLFAIKNGESMYLSGNDVSFNYVHIHSGKNTEYDDTWAINSDGHIVNVFFNKHLSVYETNADLIGHILILEEENKESLAQKFYFIKHVQK